MAAPLAEAAECGPGRQLWLGMRVSVTAYLLQGPLIWKINPQRIEHIERTLRALLLLSPGNQHKIDTLWQLWLWPSMRVHRQSSYKSAIHAIVATKNSCRQALCVVMTRSLQRQEGYVLHACIHIWMHMYFLITHALLKIIPPECIKHIENCQRICSRICSICMYVCMYVCMYMYIYIYIYHNTFGDSKPCVFVCIYAFYAFYAWWIYFLYVCIYT